MLGRPRAVGIVGSVMLPISTHHNQISAFSIGAILISMG